jgi:DNA-binding CsgD family transcriptional regulator
MQPLKRAGLLPAYVEIMLAAGELERAHAASRELDEIAERQASDVLGAVAAQAWGAVSLGEGDAGTALVSLRGALERWRELPAPYEVARVRVQIGSACRMLGDDDTAAMELDAARESFAELGAASDLASIDALKGPADADLHGLTARETEVLSLAAAGKTNRDIAAELVISEHTVARHLQNIFAKLGVSSRTAASAFAFEHDLVRPGQF